MGFITETHATIIMQTTWTGWLLRTLERHKLPLLESSMLSYTYIKRKTSTPIGRANRNVIYYERAVIP